MSNFRNALWVKIVIIVILLLLFLIPLFFVGKIISDREKFQAEAVKSILTPLGGDFTISEFSLGINYKENLTYTEVVNGKREEWIKEIEKVLLISPTFYELNIDTQTSMLTRGIFNVPTYKGVMDIKLIFELPKNENIIFDNFGNVKNTSSLILSISNNKTLSSFPDIQLQNKKLEVRENNVLPENIFSNYINFNLDGRLNSKNKIVFTGKINFQGGDKISIVPLSGDNVFSMSSDWKIPGFSGGWIPSSRNIGDKGFNAKWEIAGISTGLSAVSVVEFDNNKNIKTRYFDKDVDSYVDADAEKVIVNFFMPVGNYQKTMRSVKYALLFLLVPFLSIFLLEIFINIKIHPIQYCLIGLANIVFYLLLLSISEHISFNWSFIISAIAVTVLTSVYVAGIFRKIKWGLVIGGIEIFTYIFLFGTLQAEDYALLVGTLGLFVILSTLMFITKSIDWYKNS